MLPNSRQVVWVDWRMAVSIEDQLNQILNTCCRYRSTNAIQIGSRYRDIQLFYYLFYFRSNLHLHECIALLISMVIHVCNGGNGGGVLVRQARRWWEEVRESERVTQVIVIWTRVQNVHLLPMRWVREHNRPIRHLPIGEREEERERDRERERERERERAS